MAENKDINIRVGIQGANQVAQDAKKIGRNLSASFRDTNKTATDAAQGISAIGGIVGMVNAEAGNAIRMLGGLATGFRNMAKAAVAFVTTPVGMAFAGIAAAAGTLAVVLSSAKKRAKELKEEIAFNRAQEIVTSNRIIQDTFDQLGRTIDRTTDKLKSWRELVAMRTETMRGIQDARAEYQTTTALSGARNDQERQRIQAEANYQQGYRALDRERADIMRQAEEVGGDAAINMLKKRRTALETKLVEQGNIEDAERANLKDVEKTARGEGDVTDEEIKAAKKEARDIRNNANSSLNQAIRAQEQTFAEMQKIDREIEQAEKKRKEILEKLKVTAEKEAALKAKNQAEIQAMEKARAQEMDALYQDNIKRAQAEAEADWEIAKTRTHIRDTEEEKLRFTKQDYEASVREFEAAQRRIRKLDEAFEDPETWGAMSDAEQKKNRRDRADAAAEEARQRSRMVSLNSQLMSMAKDYADRADARSVQVANLGRGNTANRLTALGLYGGSVSPMRFAEETAKNTNLACELLKQELHAVRGLDTSARVQE